MGIGVGGDGRVRGDRDGDWSGAGAVRAGWYGCCVRCCISVSRDLDERVVIAMFCYLVLFCYCSIVLFFILLVCHFFFIIAFISCHFC